MKKQDSLTESFERFFQEENILSLSDKNIDEVFFFLYNDILKEAVYPHLTKLLKNDLSVTKIEQSSERRPCRSTMPP